MARFACIPANGTEPRPDDDFEFEDDDDFECHVVDPPERDIDGKLLLWVVKPGAGADKCRRLSELHGSLYRQLNAVATIAFGGGQFRGLPSELHGPVYVARHNYADADAGTGGGSGAELPLPLRWRRHINDAHSIHADRIYPKDVDLSKGRLWVTCSPKEQNECIPVGLSDDGNMPVLPFRSHICDISGGAARRYHSPRFTSEIPASVSAEPEAGTETEPLAKRRKPNGPAAKTPELVVVEGTEQPFGKYVVWVTLRAHGLSLTPWFRPQWPDRVGKPGRTSEACLDFNAALNELVFNRHGGRCRSGNSDRVGLAGDVPPGGYKTDKDYFAQCGHWRAGKGLLACEWMATLLFAACVYGYEGAGKADFQQKVLWCEHRDGICQPRVSNYKKWLENPGSVRPCLL